MKPVGLEKHESENRNESIWNTCKAIFDYQDSMQVKIHCFLTQHYYIRKSFTIDTFMEKKKPAVIEKFDFEVGGLLI